MKVRALRVRSVSFEKYSAPEVVCFERLQDVGTIRERGSLRYDECTWKDLSVLVDRVSRKDLKTFVKNESSWMRFFVDKFPMKILANRCFPSWFQARITRLYEIASS